MTDKMWETPLTGPLKLLSVAVSYGGVFWTAWTVRLFWSKLLVPAFGQPWPYATVLGALVLLGLLRARVDWKYMKEPETEGHIITRVVLLIVTNLMLLSYLWVVP